MKRLTPLSRISLLLAVLALSGCAATSGVKTPQDPFESMNRSIYKFNDALDRAVLKPVAKGYEVVVPKVGRTMVSNFFSHLDDVVVTVNDVLQLKLRQAVSDFGRVFINTTIGVLGLIDAASATGYEKHNEDFGQTLGYWGIGTGPFLMLPLLGPSNFRDGIGLYIDSVYSPVGFYKNVRVRNQSYILKGISIRAGLLDSENILDTAQVDPYAFLRDAYLQRRQSLVYDGHPPRPKYYEEDE
jgi:phospholipid-binding lipoprotein MlaA